MEIKVLYDNKAIRGDLSAGWGFSCLVGGNVLFDTGEEEKSLIHNMKEKGIEASCITDIVISHDHWDHTGGLKGILRKREGIKVYGCPGFSKEFKENVKNMNGQLVEVKDFVEVKNNIFVTGAVLGTHKGQNIEEQALVIKTPKGLTIITGCAHPGIVKIAGKVKERFSNEKLYCVIGGFHLKDKQKEEITNVIEKLKVLGISKIGPAHCTGEESLDIFKKSFGKNFITIATGKECEV